MLFNFTSIKYHILVKYIKWIIELVDAGEISFNLFGFTAVAFIAHFFSYCLFYK